MKIPQRFLFLFLILLLMLQTGCRDMEATIGDTFILKYGNEIEMAPSPDVYPSSVKFNEVVTDSRCPEDAYCFWAGEVIIELIIDDRDTLRGGPGATFYLEPGNIVKGSSGNPDPDKMKLHIIEVNPYPKSGWSNNFRNYKATLEIYK